MRRTNVFIEVEDNVYDIVVEPHKRAKTFSRLIAALLKGYIEDDYVRAYGDDMVDDLKKASVDSLDSALSDMQASLANIGLFTDELQMVNTKGSNFFSKKQEDFKESVEKTEEFIKPSVEEESNKELKEENNSLKEEIELIKGQMSEMYRQNSLIMEMLSKGITPKNEESSVVDVEEKEEIVKEPIDVPRFEESDMVVSPSIEEVSAVTVVEEEVKEVEESTEEKPMFDMGFLSDAAMSF